MSNLEIKLATLAHRNELARIFQQYCLFYGTKPTLKACENFIQQRLNKSDSIIFLGFERQIAIGFAQVYPSFSSVAMKPIWVLNDLFIEQESRQKGYATALLDTLEKFAKEKDIFSIKLATQKSNAKAKKLYQKLGYQLNTEFDFFSKSLL